MANVTAPAKGNAKSGSTPALTPAPIHQTFGGKGDQPYGNNRFGQASSDPPGQNTTSGFEAMRDPSGVIDTVQAKGLRPDDDSLVSGQIRKIAAAGAIPAHPGMAKRGIADGSPGGSVPNAVGLVEAQPVRKPGGAS